MPPRTVAATRALALGLILISTVAACRRGRGWKEEVGPVAATWKPKPAAVSGVAPELLRTAILSQLDAARPRGIAVAQWKRVRDLYASYGGAPLWLEEDGTRDRAQALVRELAKAPTHALRLGDYPLAELRDALEAVHAAKSPAAEQLAAADVLLSAAYVAHAQNLLVGQVDPRAVSQGWHIDPQKVDVDSALAQRLTLEPLDRAIAQLRPEDADYDSLRTQLDRYREINALGGWPRVSEGKRVRPRDTTSADRLGAVAARLAIEGYLADSSLTSAPADRTAPNVPRAVYDLELAAAVADYQAHHAIVVDSILGGETLESLNLPASYRAGQLAANLERLRWLPRSLGARYVLVNVPAFRLAVHDNGRKALEMRVVVGAEFKDRATPVFADSMAYVVFRPYWNVTSDIAVKELLPKVWSEPGYLARHGYEVVRGQAEDASPADPSGLSEGALRSGKLRIRQKPGDENSLGYVKFIFPNDYNIYLHDTPQRDLFARDVRAYSHGCIRVERPLELAEFVLGWSQQRVQEAMSTGPDNTRAKLPQKLPVYIVYLTTYMQDGQLYFGNDLYNRDDALVKQVVKGWSPDSASVKILEQLEKLVN